MKNDPVIAALAALDGVPLHTAEGQKQIAKALASRWNLVAAKAARIAGEAQRLELKDALATAFERFRRGGSQTDKGCTAMTAIMRALYSLEYDGHEPFLEGVRHVQREPVWGGSVDTAAELRAVCAMGLTSTRYPGTLRELVQLLVDAEWQARAGAVRALAANGSEAACLLVRLKALSGDAEPEVLGDCFRGLLAMEGMDAFALVTSGAGNEDAGVAEAALIALGESRRAEAIAWLRENFAKSANLPRRKSVLLALATSRTDEALDFVFQLIEEGNEENSRIAVSAMDIHRADERILKRVDGALRVRAGLSERD